MTDTQPPTLAPPPPPSGRTAGRTAGRGADRGAGSGRGGELAVASARHRWWSIPLVLVALAVLVAITVAALLPSELLAENPEPFRGSETEAPYARTPASAEPVDERIRFGDLGDVAEQYPPTGDFYFVTVVEPRQSLLSWLIGRDEPAVEFLTDAERNGTQTPQQRRTLALESMRTSEQTAQFVALRRIGYDVELIPGEVLIGSMVCLEANEAGTECVRWSPSDEVLDPGDQVLRVDGVDIEGVEDIGRALADRSPGDVVEIRIDRPGEGELDLDVELTAAPGEEERTIVGFMPFDTRRVELPFVLDINTGSIGGPSAGLAFTLTLIDELTPGELTGGKSVAVTGGIEIDGSVTGIGGLRQKASAVAQTGVEVFLVPAAQGEADIAAARAAGGDGLEIIPVATLDEAIDVLIELGGDPLDLLAADE